MMQRTAFDEERFGCPRGMLLEPWEGRTCGECRYFHEGPSLCITCFTSRTGDVTDDIEFLPVLATTQACEVWKERT